MSYAFFIASKRLKLFLNHYATGVRMSCIVFLKKDGTGMVRRYMSAILRKQSKKNNKTKKQTGKASHYLWGAFSYNDRFSAEAPIYLS